MYIIHGIQSISFLFETITLLAKDCCQEEDAQPQRCICSRISGHLVSQRKQDYWELFFKTNSVTGINGLVMILFLFSSIPAVLCSNNWQAAISNQPSTSNHVANEPIGLNQVTPIPVVIHQLPDLDQYSRTVNPPPGTEKITTDSSVTTRPPDQTNNNNNNENDSQEIRYHSAANRAVDDVCLLNSDSHRSIQINSTDQLLGPNRSVRTHLTTNGTTAESQASSQTVTPRATAAITNGAGSAMPTTSSQPSQFSGAANDSQTENGVANEPMTTNAVADEPQTSSETANEQPAINGEDVQED